MLHLIAFRNVKVHWRQSLAALLSISAAFYSFVLFQGYVLEVRRQYLDGYRNRSMYGEMIIQNRNASSVEAQKDPWKYTLSPSDQALIAKALEKRSSEIEGHVRFLNFQGLIATGRASKIFLAQASDVEMGAKVRGDWKWNVLYGEPLQETQISNPVILGQGLGHQLGCEPDQKIYSLRPEGGYPPERRVFHCQRPDLQLSVTTESGNLNAMDFEVAGLTDAGYKDIDTRYLVLPLPLAQRLLNTEQISFWTVKLKDPSSQGKWIAGLNQEISAGNPDLQVVDWRDHNVGEIYKKTMSLLNIFRNFVTTVVAFISILSVMNTMVKIVKERTREIGTLLSMGFQRSQVLGIFLLEALFLGVLGCVVGAVAALVMSLILNHANITYKAGLLSQPVHFRILMDPSLYSFAMGLLLTLTVTTSYLTCRSTTRKKIVECLGHV
jgi:putative ABC transport system permease protein